MDIGTELEQIRLALIRMNTPGREEVVSFLTAALLALYEALEIPDELTPPNDSKSYRDELSAVLESVPGRAPALEALTSEREAGLTKGAWLKGHHLTNAVHRIRNAGNRCNIWFDLPEDSDFLEFVREDNRVRHGDTESRESGVARKRGKKVKAVPAWRERHANSVEEVIPFFRYALDKL